MSSRQKAARYFAGRIDGETTPAENTNRNEDDSGSKSLAVVENLEGSQGADPSESRPQSGTHGTHGSKFKRIDAGSGVSRQLTPNNSNRNKRQRVLDTSGGLIDRTRSTVLAGIGRENLKDQSDQSDGESASSSEAESPVPIRKPKFVRKANRETGPDVWIEREEAQRRSTLDALKNEVITKEIKTEVIDDSDGIDPMREYLDWRDRERSRSLLERARLAEIEAQYEEKILAETA